MVLNKLYGYRKTVFHIEIVTYEYHNVMNVQGREGGGGRQGLYITWLYKVT